MLTSDAVERGKMRMAIVLLNITSPRRPMSMASAAGSVRTWWLKAGVAIDVRCDIE